jgi:hypothetical protein
MLWRTAALAQTDAPPAGALFFLASIFHAARCAFHHTECAAILRFPSFPKEEIACRIMKNALQVVDIKQ